MIICSLRRTYGLVRTSCTRFRVTLRLLHEINLSHCLDALDPCIQERSLLLALLARRSSHARGERQKTRAPPGHRTARLGIPGVIIGSNRASVIRRSAILLLRGFAVAGRYGGHCPVQIALGVARTQPTLLTSAADSRRTPFRTIVPARHPITPLVALTRLRAAPAGRGRTGLVLCTRARWCALYLPLATATWHLLLCHLLALGLCRALPLRNASQARCGTRQQAVRSARCAACHSAMRGRGQPHTARTHTVRGCARVCAVCRGVQKERTSPASAARTRAQREQTHRTSALHAQAPGKCEAVRPHRRGRGRADSPAAHLRTSKCIRGRCMPARNLGVSWDPTNTAPLHARAPRRHDSHKRASTRTQSREVAH